MKRVSLPISGTEILQVEMARASESSGDEGEQKSSNAMQAGLLTISIVIFIGMLGAYMMFGGGGVLFASTTSNLYAFSPRAVSKASL